MSPAKLDALLARIDAAVGPPENETVEEQAARRLMVQRDAEAREIRKASTR